MAVGVPLELYLLEYVRIRVRDRRDRLFDLGRFAHADRLLFGFDLIPLQQTKLILKGQNFEELTVGLRQESNRSSSYLHSVGTMRFKGWEGLFNR